MLIRLRWRSQWIAYMGPQCLRNNHFHHQLEFTLSRWTGLELNVWWMERSYYISVLGGFPSLWYLPGSPICPSCDFLSCSLSASFLLYFLSVSSAAFTCHSLRSHWSGPGSEEARTWEDSGSMPTFLPKHSLLLGIHWDARLSVFLISLPVL